MTKRMRVARWWMVVVAIAATTCRHEAERRQPTPLDLTTVGVIEGEVRFPGTPPPATVVDMSSAKDCPVSNPRAVQTDDVLVRDDKVQNAIVAITSGLGDRVFAVPQTPVVVDQRGCLFSPRVVAAQAGQPVKFLNSDPLAHNVHGSDRKSTRLNSSHPSIS